MTTTFLNNAITSYTTSGVSPVYTSGFMAPAVDTNQAYTFVTTDTFQSGMQGTTGNVLTTTGQADTPYWIWGQGNAGGILPNTMPNIGMGQWPANGYTFPPLVPLPGPPDLDSLEEGVHPIKGGKIIIKKIMVDDSEMDEALREAFAAEEEANKELHEELEEMSASEERAV